MSESVEELAIKLRNLSDDFDGEDSPADVLRALLEGEISELTEYEKAVSEKQEALQEDFVGRVVENSDAEGLSEVEQKQEELRKKFMER